MALNDDLESNGGPWLQAAPTKLVTACRDLSLLKRNGSIDYNMKYFNYCKLQQNVPCKNCKPRLIVEDIRYYKFFCKKLRSLQEIQAGYLNYYL